MNNRTKGCRVVEQEHGCRKCCGCREGLADETGIRSDSLRITRPEGWYESLLDIFCMLHRDAPENAYMISVPIRRLSGYTVTHVSFTAVP